MVSPRIKLARVRRLVFRLLHNSLEQRYYLPGNGPKRPHDHPAVHGGGRTSLWPRADRSTRTDATVSAVPQPHRPVRANGTRHDAVLLFSRAAKPASAAPKYSSIARTKVPVTGIKGYRPSGQVLWQRFSVSLTILTGGAWRPCRCRTRIDDDALGNAPPPRTGGPPVTNIRNTASPHWRGWLKPETRCLVPLNSFAECESEPES